MKYTVLVVIFDRGLTPMRWEEIEADSISEAHLRAWIRGGDEGYQEYLRECDEEGLSLTSHPTAVMESHVAYFAHDDEGDVYVGHDKKDIALAYVENQMKANPE